VHQETVRIVDAQLNDMAVQMAALDEFVTRARSQNDRHHTAHAISLGGLSTKVHCAFKSVEESLEATSGNLSAFGTDNSTAFSSLQDALGPLTEEVHQSLDRLQADVQSAPLQEYIHTGETPQKKDWAYPTSLPQTEDHASVLAKLRGLPDPTQHATSSAARTPGRSPRKMASPKKLYSPSKLPSPSKGKVYTDVVDIEDGNAHAHRPATSGTSGLGGGLKEIDLNIVQPSCQRPVPVEGLLSSEFSKSVGSGMQQPPLKRHATTGIEGSRLPTKLGISRGAGKAKADGWEKENHTINVLSQSVGAGGGHGRRLRSSPQQ
jgi:kinesin family protein 11